ncbi:hypothetical protein IQ267_03685 [filamentous cyanobacterium LEGE 07170]|nr:hypothetical protein [filamentous cyanobacterium LEGE 07170]
MVELSAGMKTSWIMGLALAICQSLSNTEKRCRKPTTGSRNTSKDRLYREAVTGGLMDKISPGILAIAPTILHPGSTLNVNQPAL